MPSVDLPSLVFQIYQMYTYNLVLTIYIVDNGSKKLYRFCNTTLANSPVTYYIT